VASLPSCHMLWFISLARAEQLRVAAYEDEAEGTMDATRFTGVVLRPRVSFEHDPGAERVMDLHHRATSAASLPLSWIAASSPPMPAVLCVQVEPRSAPGRQ
jgi:hypothetical protein